jgi:hypothetical protein
LELDEPPDPLQLLKGKAMHDSPHTVAFSPFTSLTSTHKASVWPEFRPMWQMCNNFMAAIGKKNFCAHRFVNAMLMSREVGIAKRECNC